MEKKLPIPIHSLSLLLFPVMKTIKPIVVFLLLSLSVAAQNDTMIGSPPGYYNSMLFRSGGMVTDSADNIWIAYGKIGLVKYDGTGWTVYDSLNSPLLKNQILSVACNNSGVWAGTDTGLFNFNGSGWMWMNNLNSTLPSDTVSKLYSPGGNNLYLFSTNGFAHYNGIFWQQYNSTNSNLVDNNVQCIFKDVSGLLWIGTSAGLSAFDGSTWQNYTTLNSALPSDNISTISEDGHHHLFIGTYDRGIYFLSDGEFISPKDFTSSYDNFPSSITRILRMSDGTIVYSGYKDWYFKADPIEIQNSNGFFASDTNYLGVIDSHDRIWRLGYRTIPKLWMRDSLSGHPIVPPSSYNDLDINQVRCGMWNDNTFHWEKVGNSRYEVPKGSFRNSVFASALWIGGLDPGNNLHMAAQTYRQSGSDYWPGPLDTVVATIDTATKLLYDSLWKINKWTIDEFITQYNIGNVTNGSYAIPNEIKYWPAHGNGNYSRKLAPFVDLNGDGIYNPLNGDYPEIKGDQMLWWVMNDNFGTHRETDGVALGIEIHSKAYAYSCPAVPDSNEAVNYTTF